VGSESEIERRRAAARARQARYRERRRNCVYALKVVVNEVDLAETLCAANLLHPQHDDDRAALEAALQLAIDLWVTRNGAA
jgi:hypothetical protein